ncbi:MAG TPA: ATP-binding protein [Verrucomicrobiae bacterium]|nr:ATP-binding protein [Verrucomicrobiae bacterium]
MQRKALRRGLWRASLASIVVLLIVVGLAVGIAWKANQSQTDAERARLATQRAEAELWNAKLNEARARRIAGGPGARVESSLAVRELVQRPDLDETQILALRQEAIAQLALVDVEVSTNWIPKERDAEFFWDESCTRYVKVKAAPLGKISVRSYPGNEIVRQFEVYTNAALRRAAFSADGKLLGAGFKDGQVRVWRIEDGALLLSTRGTGASGYVYPFFSPDSRLVGVVSSQTNWARGDGLRLYDLTSGEVYLKSPLAPTFAQFTPDGRHLAIALRGELRVLATTNGNTVASVKVPVEGYTLVAWHPNGQRLAVAGGNGRLLVWDVWAATEPKAFVGHPNVITDLAFSPDGSMLLSHGWDSIANFWEPLSGRRLLAERRVGIRRFTPEGRLLAHMSEGRNEGVQTLLSRTGFRTVASTGRGAQPTDGVWIHPQSRLIAAAYPEAEGVRVWTFPDGEEVARLPGQWAQFTRDGKALLTFSRDAVRQYEIPAQFSSCGLATEWRAQMIYRPSDGRAISKGMVGADGRTLVIGENQSVVLFDLAAEREPKRFKAFSQHGSLSLDGQWLVTCKHQDYGSLIRVSTGEKLRSIPPMNWAEFSPDGRCLAVMDSAALRLYSTNAWEQGRRIRLEVGSGTGPGFCFAPDGQTFAIAYNRQDVRLHETESGRELATFSSPDPTPITGGCGLAFSSDARWLIAARNDGDIVAWELPKIRTELAKVGLDWGNENRLKAALRTASARASEASFGIISARTAGFLAASFAIGAGLFIFIMQRRMIAGYERIEAVTVEQRAKLHTAQDELVHSQKMRALGTLAAGIAHDFNNLLSVIRLSNQLAAEETKATGAARENMDAVESAVAQGETIVQSMLGYSRAATETGHEYSVAAALSETVAMLGKKFLSGIVLKLEIAPDLPLVHGARGRLEQMLLNLVVNAAEAMKGQGTLRLAARIVDACPCVLQPRRTQCYIEVSISDSGPGIPSDILPRIFEPFFTTKNAGARPGTGLGLSTVYTMAQQDGVGLGIDTSEGNGTTFRIVIPVGATNPVIDDKIQHNIGLDL